MTTAITIEGLTKAYGSKRAVDGLDLEVEQGEVFALLGPNGAGKTTTVEILEGFRDPRRRARRASSARTRTTAGLAWRNRIGIVLQGSTGLDLLTPREALSSTAKAYSRPRPVEEVLDLGGARRTRPRPGSPDCPGGSAVGSTWRSASSGHPELLFLDEPTTGFDPQARRDFWELIRSLATEGTTILLTTHYLDEAEQLADRVGVIAGGRMLAIDTPGQPRRPRRPRRRPSAGRRAGSGIRCAPPTRPPRWPGCARRFEGEVPALSVHRPTLEDTYLALIAPHLDGEDTGSDRPVGTRKEALR